MTSINYLCLKRILDTFFSFFLILLFFPFFLIIIFAIAFFLGRPIFFIQRRLGKDLRVFRLYKFRTMTPSSVFKDDSLRLTTFGKFLRRSGFDELPQLFNIIKGDMSFIGPRPLLIEYLAYFDKNQIKRHLVRPGLTGYAQVNGRNKTSWGTRFKHDLWYIKNISFLTDLKILLKTFIYIFSFSEFQSPKSQSMIDFRLSKYNKFNRRK